MEQTEKRYRANRDELLRTVVGLDSGLISLEQANGEGVVGMDRVSPAASACLTTQNKKRKRPDEQDAPVIVPPPPPKKPRESAALGPYLGAWRRSLVFDLTM